MGEKVSDNGKGTIGEDIADNGGLRAAYKGWEMYMAENTEDVKQSAQQIKGVLVPDGINNLVPANQQQLFFIAFAYVWENIL
jgi:predicted metalloendopeptidase